MEEVVFKAERRDVIGKKVKALRRAGKLPAVLYGHRIDPIPVQFEMKETSRILNQLAPSDLVKIQIGDVEHNALVRAKQRDVLTGEIEHVDFHVISMEEKFRTSFALTFIGESPAVEEFGAIVIIDTEQVTIECLPLDVPDHITVDLSTLTEIGDVINLRDLNFPENVDLLDDPDGIVVVVSAPQAEEEEEEEEEELLDEFDLEEPEVIERGKQEEDEEEF
jgi:large subunit ribosomal protein L25